MADGSEASSPKRRRVEDDETSGEQIDWQQIRDLKQQCNQNFMAVEALLNTVPDSKAIEVWSKLSVMSSAFSQLMQQTAAAFAEAQQAPDLAPSHSLQLQARGQKNIGTQTDSSQATDAQRIMMLEQQLKYNQTANSTLLFRLRQREAEYKVLHKKHYPTDGLPIKCLQRILSFCSITDVYNGCMSVNKKWFEASNSDLKTRESVSIYWHRKRVDIPAFNHYNDVIVISKKANTKKTVKSLMRMTAVTTIWLESVSEKQMKSVSKLLRVWSPNLTTVHMIDCKFSHGFGLRFPRLNSFLSLRTPLTVSSMRLFRDMEGPSKALERLHIQLQYDYEEQIDLLSNLTNLTDLKLTLVASNDSTNASEKKNLLKICRSFQRLVTFEVFYLTKAKFPLKASGVDPAIAALVDQNPGLRQITLKRLPLSGKSLHSFARLQHLQELKIHNEEYMDISGEEIIYLLTVGSNRSLRSVTIGRGLGLEDEDEAAIAELIESTGIQCNILCD